jgi:hypothetical protein
MGEGFGSLVDRVVVEFVEHGVVPCRFRCDGSGKQAPAGAANHSKARDRNRSHRNGIRSE